MARLGEGGLDAFQIGQSLSGTSPLADFAKAMNARAQELGMLRQKARIETDEKIRAAGPIATAEAQAKSAANPFKSLIDAQMGGATGGEQKSDYLMTGFNTEGVANFESPSAAGQVAGAKSGAQQQAQHEADIVPRAQAFHRSLKSMAQLARQIPAPKAGLQRPFQAAGTAIKGYTQEIPQVEMYNRKRGAIAGQLTNLLGGEKSSRLSDQDVKRVLQLLTAPVSDIQELRDLSNVELLDALNALPELKRIGGVSYLDVLTPTEILNGRRGQGRSGGELLEDDQGNLAVRYEDGEVEQLF